MHGRRGRSLLSLALIAGFIISGLIGVAVTPAQTPTDTVNLLARTQGMTMTDALRLLYAQQSVQIAEQDSLVPEICFVIDDNIFTQAQWDTLKAAFRLVSPTGAAISRTYSYKFNVGFSVEPQSAQKWTDLDAHVVADTAVGGNLSTQRLRTLQLRGDDMGTVGWDERGSLWNGDTGKVATGNMTSTNLFDNMITMAVLAQRDTMGLGMPRWISWSNSSCTSWQKQLAHRAGIEFGFQSGQTASVGAGSGERPNYIFPQRARLQSGSADQYGMTNATGIYLSSLPGSVTDRYEIAQTLGEQSDTAATYKALRCLVANPGSKAVWIGHSFATWDTNLQGSAVFGTVSGVMWRISQYVRQGRLRVVTPSQLADDTFNNPPGPGANWLQGNFRDSDADGQVDNWACCTSGNSFPAGAVGVATSGTGSLVITTGGYRGKKIAALNWSGVNKINGASMVATDPAGNTITKAWASVAAGPVIYAPPRGWVAHIEFMAREDTTKCSLVRHGGDGGTADGAPHTGGALGDSIGVNFIFTTLSHWNTVRNGYSPTLLWQRDLGTNWMPWFVSFPTFLGANAGAHFKLAGRQRIGLGAAYEWAHCEFEYEVPDNADVMYIPIWQGGSQQVKSIQISDVRVSFRPRDPWRSTTRRTPFVN